MIVSHTDRTTAPTSPGNLRLLVLFDSPLLFSPPRILATSVFGISDPPHPLFSQVCSIIPLFFLTKASVNVVVVMMKRAAAELPGTHGEWMGTRD